MRTGPHRWWSLRWWSVVLVWAMLIGWPASPPAAAQNGPVASSLQDEFLVPTAGIGSNEVLVLEADRQTLWVGPRLHRTPDEGESFESAVEPINRAIEDGRGALDDDTRVSALYAQENLVWAGLSTAFNDSRGADGLAFSTDGGETFTFRFPPLDAPADTTVEYGISTLSAAAITREIGSVPTGVTVHPETGAVWIAGGDSGVRRSDDEGETWDRVVLPPDDQDRVDPTEANDYFVGPPERGGSLNHVAFDVLVDEQNTVWAGTGAGLNRSTAADAAEGPDRAWQRFAYEDAGEGLTGSQVVAIREQELDGERNPIWAATWPSGTPTGAQEEFGVTVTRDGGDTFDQTLLGRRIFDLAFGEDRIYAVGDQLYVSDDEGATWETVRDFPLEDPDDFLPSDLAVNATATTSGAVWVGTDEGLLRQRPDEDTWSLFRADVPLRPDPPRDEAPPVDTYAYPNPFAPSSDEFVRIRYELDEPRDVTVRIFDFNMNLVRQITDRGQASGEQETPWDGRTDDGLRVANGPYFYTVDVGSGEVRGKILVVE